MLASSGKDRSLCLYALSAGAISSDSGALEGKGEGDGDNNPFALVEVQKGAHKRIVWDLSWARVRDQKEGLEMDQHGLLMSGSRDGTCKIWSVASGSGGSSSVANTSKGDVVALLTCVYSFTPFAGSAVTALHFSMHYSLTDADGACRVALGSETGSISVWEINKISNGEKEGEEEKEEYSFSAEVVGVVDEFLAHGAAVKRLRWCPKAEQDNSCRLASCGEDNTVRIYRIYHDHDQSMNRYDKNKKADAIITDSIDVDVDVDVDVHEPDGTESCPNQLCKCKECTCGAGCTCGVSLEVVCDPCAAFKVKIQTKTK